MDVDSGIPIAIGGWWVRWRDSISSPPAAMFHEELVFENNNREALVDYTSHLGYAFDSATKKSVLSYCATFNV